MVQVRDFSMKTTLYPVKHGTDGESLIAIGFVHLAYQRINKR
jgi:hypothetical protein